MLYSFYRINTFYFDFFIILISNPPWGLEVFLCRFSRGLVNSPHLRGKHGQVASEMAPYSPRHREAKPDRQHVLFNGRFANNDMT